MDLQILPLAITMMAGPQIVSAIILVTHERRVRVSLAFLAGVAIAATVGVIIARGLASLLGNAVSLGDPSKATSLGKIIQIALVALLLIAAVKNYLGRETAEPPEWLKTLLSADEKRAFTTGLLLILLMPSDVAVMFTVGVHLEQAGYMPAVPGIASGHPCVCRFAWPRPRQAVTIFRRVLL